MDARASYQAGRTAAEHDLRTTERSARAIGSARILVGLAAIALVAAIVWAPLPPSAWGFVAGHALAFVALVFVHAAVYRRKERAAAARAFHQRGLDRLDGRWSDFASTGERFKTAEHPYADDLDVFGRSSLFQLLDASATRYGEERLAAWLGGTEPGDTSSPQGASSARAAIVARQVAVRDLEPRVAFRERLCVEGAALGARKPDPSAFLAWAEGASPLSVGPTVRWAAYLLPLTVVLGLAFGPRVGVPRAIFLLLVGAELALLTRLRPSLSRIVDAVSSTEHSLSSYAEMLGALERERFEAPLLQELQQKLRASGAQATFEMAALGRIVGFVDARQNEVFRLFVAPVLMWDFHCAAALERWRLRAGKVVRGWFEALGEMEALASLAGFAFDRPDHAWPRFADAPAFEAEGLGHPLIPGGRCVRNDVALPAAGHVLIVTGSNMSGKSTLLRAVGVNAVLALAGAPVCAKSLTLGPVVVFTSMRVRDSLAEGVSRFYAELRKLKSVIDAGRARPGVLFVLDEILHGTNSRERLIGARAIVRELLAHEALGAVSTHDLAISDLATEMPGKVRNVHFEEQVAADDTMTFDYKLRDGVVHSSNALRLMKIVGIDVV